MTPLFGFMGSGRIIDEVMPEPNDFLRLAQQVDSLGYDSIWVGDHISTHNPVMDAMTILTYFGTVTKRVKLGTGVLLLALRDPSLVAKQISTLDWLTSGRVIVGVGVGGEDPSDFNAVGVPIKERGARTGESILAMKSLWASDSASHHGKFYNFDEVSIKPQSIQDGGPPVWLGGRSLVALRRIARVGDGWYSYMVSPRRFADGMTIIQDEAKLIGRDISDLSGALLVPIRIGDNEKVARRELADHLANRYAKKFDDHVIDNYCLAGTALKIRDRIKEYLQAGVSHVVFMHAGPVSELQDASAHIYEEVVNKPWN
jgi:probable F420-dependent oxidoreductase